MEKNPKRDKHREKKHRNSPEIVTHYSQNFHEKQNHKSSSDEDPDYNAKEFSILQQNLNDKFTTVGQRESNVNNEILPESAVEKAPMASSTLSLKYDKGCRNSCCSCCKKRSSVSPTNDEVARNENADSPSIYLTTTEHDNLGKYKHTQLRTEKKLQHHNGRVDLKNDNKSKCVVM